MEACRPAALLFLFFLACHSDLATPTKCSSRADCRSAAGATGALLCLEGECRQCGVDVQCANGNGDAGVNPGSPDGSISIGPDGGSTSNSDGGSIGPDAGNASGDAGTGSDSIPQAQFFTHLVASYCGRLYACCTADQITANSPPPLFGLPSLGPDEASCNRNVLGYLGSHAPDPSRTVYDEQAAKSCIATMNGVACADELVNSGVDNPACKSVFRGTQPVGGQCKSELECASNLCADYACAQPASNGEPCPIVSKAEGKLCEPGLYDDDIRGQCTCSLLIRNGESCQNDQQCFSSHCDWSSSTCMIKPKKPAVCTKGP